MPAPSTRTAPPQRFAVIGAGIAGLACARTLAQAGREVTLFEKSAAPGGRVATRETAFGSFDHGAQYLTVRDARLRQVLDTTPGVTTRWKANAVRVMDAVGHVIEAHGRQADAWWVGQPGMSALPRAWAEPLGSAGRLLTDTRVVRIERDALDARAWQLQTAGPADEVHVYSGFDAVLLAIPAPQAAGLLRHSALLSDVADRLAPVEYAPCWTLMLAFPQATRSGTLGPQWNAAQGAHHRIGWLARESAKPGRGPVERWTVQASPTWSAEHLEDEPQRVEAKLLRAFAEVTGIRAQPGYTDVKRWRYARTTAPLGESHVWAREAGIGLCGDWCIGHRVEDAFISGLELALAAL